MTKKNTIDSFTDAEIDEMIARGDVHKTEWERLDRMTEEELEASIDIEDEGYPLRESATAELPMPKSKRSLTLRFDPDVLDWFKATGPGWQTRINAVLKQYVQAQTTRK